MPNELANLRRRVNRAERWPENTCNASQNVQNMAEELLRVGAAAIPEDGCRELAISMLATVEALWKARTELAKLRRGAT